MTNISFLAHFSNEFQRPTAYALIRLDGRKELIGSEQLDSLNGRICTFRLRELINCVGRSLALDQVELFDIEDSIRLLFGKSKDDGGEKDWDLWKNLRRYIANSQDFDAIFEISESRPSRLDRLDSERLLLVAVKGLEELWLAVQKELIARNELKRFNKVEIPVRAIFNVRQATGIKVDGSLAESFINTLEDVKYKSFIKLAQILKKSPMGFTLRDFAKHAGETDSQNLSKYYEFDNIEDYVDLNRHGSQFAEHVWSYVKSDQNVRILSHGLDSSGRVFPHFACHGTVTSRILVLDPYLQGLKREYRGIIQPDDDFVFTYLDYSQFEPGIIAHMSGDPEFIRLYNSTDLYESLSIDLYADKRNRDICKKIFLAYCFGMSPVGIVSLIGPSSTSVLEVQRMTSIIEIFFGRFEGLVKLREAKRVLLMDQGFAISEMGNKRYRTSKMNLTGKEMRWALNHCVQATASLIFKLSLIKIAAGLGAGSIVLPMHDGVLLQVHADDKRSAVDFASGCMKSVFREICPSIHPRVVTSSFAVGNAPA